MNGLIVLLALFAGQVEELPEPDVEAVAGVSVGKIEIIGPGGAVVRIIEVEAGMGVRIVGLVPDTISPPFAPTPVDHPIDGDRTHHKESKNYDGGCYGRRCGPMRKMCRMMGRRCRY
jgi:hypothetical protein